MWRRTASAVASTRFAAPSFRAADRACSSMVRFEMPRIVPASQADFPQAIQVRTSTSRGVSEWLEGAPAAWMNS
jgi:hypothetical protein